jgi:UDP-glucose 4-epimerase
MKFLITGGAGFIGSHIAEELLKTNKGEVIIFDNLSVGKKENIPKGCSLINGDITSQSQLTEAMKGVDIVFHDAAFVSIRASFDKAKLTEELDINCTGTLNVLNAAVENKVKKIIFASSMAIYGKPLNIAAKEEDRITPFSPYGLSKLRGELYCKTFKEQFGINYTILRYFNTFGIKQTPSPYVGVTTTFIKQALEGKPLTICGDGTQTRDFVSVKDIAKANILAAFSNVEGTFNIGSGKETSVNQIANKIIEVLKGNKTYIDNPPGEISRICADITQAKEKLNYTPTGNILEELPAIINWWKKELEK